MTSIIKKQMKKGWAGKQSYKKLRTKLNREWKKELREREIIFKNI